MGGQGDGARADRDLPGRTGPGAGRRLPGRAGLGRVRWLVPAALIGLGVFTAPLGVVAAHARQQVVHTDTFVAAYAPLARDAQVQELVVDAVMGAFVESTLPDLIDAAAEGAAGLPLPGRVAEAADRLDRAAVTARVEAMTRQVVASETFATLWEQALRASHSSVTAVLSGDAVVSVDEAGVVRLELAPVVAEVRARLIDSGWWIAWLIPEVDRSIAVAEIAVLGSVVRTVAKVDTAGTWLPVIALAALAAGVWLAGTGGPGPGTAGPGTAGPGAAGPGAGGIETGRPGRRRWALVVAAVGVAAAMGLLAAGVVIGRGLVVDAVIDAGSPLSEPATVALYRAATAGAKGTALGLGVTAALLAAAAWFTGTTWRPWERPET